MLDSSDTIPPTAKATPHVHAERSRALQLPWDFPRTPTIATAARRFAFELALPAIAGGGADGADVALIAAFAISLNRYTGQATIPIDVASAGRTVALDLVVAHATCRDLLRRVRDGLQQGRRPTEAVHAVIALDDSSHEASGVDLQLAITRPDRAVFTYNEKLFKPTTIERWAGHLGILVAALAADLDAPIARLPLLAADEREWLDAIGRGARRARSAPLAHRSIEQRVAEAPGAIALRHRDRELTYLQLNQRANRLARYIAAQGIGAGARVVVCVEPSFEIAIALLGILKAGASYVPIDPAYPAARVRTILDDTRPALVLSTQTLIERLSLRELPTLALDHADLDHFSADNLDLAIEPTRTAYVYYTSGTTGAPKGVLASHANLVAYVEAARARYAIDARDVMPAIARFSFSISLFELVTPLVSGGTVVILDRDHILDLPRMAETLTEVTLFHAGPSLLRRLLRHIEQHYPDVTPFAGVRHASSGGDMVAPEILESLKRIFTAAEVFVIYGCSEISCMGCTYPVPRDVTVDKTYVGRPFDNTVVRVLDAALAPVPIGVVGEIHFAGDGLVDGYLDRPELTAGKFVDIAGVRCYRTGDLGRITEAGWLEIVGRNDFQVKVRGMRVELGEVEHHLRRAPGVRDAVAMGKDGPGGDKLIVGYLVLDDEDAADRSTRLAAIRNHMVETVPDYMVPASYVVLANLPLNHNMKVDRHALPDPEPATARSAPATHGDPSDTPTERRLAAIWRELLGSSNVSRDDHFFELGADSLLAAAMTVRVRTELHVAIDGLDVLRESLEGIAAICDRKLGIAIPPRARRPMSDRDAVETFYFGGLYGVLHGAQPATEAVLICPPLGQEGVRAHFVLAKIARQLAARGVPALVFDYYGLGNSSGTSRDAMPARWCEDVAAARDELVKRTRATRVSALGVRLGATLLCNAVSTASKIVLWDPVCRGADWYAEQAALHRRYMRGLRDLLRWRRVERPRGAEEQLGVTYSNAAIRELRALALPRPAVPIRWLSTFATDRQTAQYRALAGARDRFDSIDADCGWSDIGRFEDMIPDLGIADRIVGMVTEP